MRDFLEFKDWVMGDEPEGSTQGLSHPEVTALSAERGQSLSGLSLSGWRWGEGPKTSILLDKLREGPAYFRIKAKIPMPEKQRVSVWVDGILKAEIQGKKEISETIFLGDQASSKTHKIEISVSHFNHDESGSVFAPKDPRKLSLSFSSLRLVHAHPAPAKICPFPFTRMEAGMPTFVPCCSEWLTDEYHSLASREESHKESHGVWNGNQAQELRSKILAGDYRYCKRDVCGTYLWEKDELVSLAQDYGLATETPFHFENLVALLKGYDFMPKGPAGMTVSSDPRCNLACPSCRSEKIVKLDAPSEKRLRLSQSQIDDSSQSLLTLKLAGDGEVFFSPFLMDLLKNAPKLFPNLKVVRILTNGILFDQAMNERLAPGTGLIRSVWVSTDAGDEETYRVTRGGNPETWKRLNRNLNWMGEMRKEGRWDEFAITCVVRKANLESLPRLRDLAHRVGADRVSFSRFTPWSRMGIRDFDQEDVFNTEHPLHGRYLAIKAELETDSRVHFAV